MSAEEYEKKTESVPELGEAYWFLDDRGGVRMGAWLGVPTDWDRLEIGNVFPSLADAKLTLNKLKDRASKEEE